MDGSVIINIMVFCVGCLHSGNAYSQFYYRLYLLSFRPLYLKVAKVYVYLHGCVFTIS